MIRTRIAGLGHYLPERVMTNAELERMVDTSDRWIQDRTGIRERRIAAPHETSSSLATNAARRALEDADIDPADDRPCARRHDDAGRPLPVGRLARAGSDRRGERRRVRHERRLLRLHGGVDDGVPVHRHRREPSRARDRRGGAVADRQLAGPRHVRAVRRRRRGHRAGGGGVRRAAGLRAAQRRVEEELPLRRGRGRGARRATGTARRRSCATSTWTGLRSSSSPCTR